MFCDGVSLLDGAAYFRGYFASFLDEALIRFIYCSRRFYLLRFDDFRLFQRFWCLISFHRFDLFRTSLAAGAACLAFTGFAGPLYIFFACTTLRQLPGLYWFVWAATLTECSHSVSYFILIELEGISLNNNHYSHATLQYFADYHRLHLIDYFAFLHAFKNLLISSTSSTHVCSHWDFI
jgi:hypothetical protein